MIRYTVEATENNVPVGVGSIIQSISSDIVYMITVRYHFDKTYFGLLCLVDAEIKHEAETIEELLRTYKYTAMEQVDPITFVRMEDYNG